MPKKALVIHPRDNVATALEDVYEGEEVEIERGGRVVRVTARARIPFGHKIAIERIRRGEEVIKYGEAIGIASADIEIGDHVHVHNVESAVGRREK